MAPFFIPCRSAFIHRFIPWSAQTRRLKSCDGHDLPFVRKFRSAADANAPAAPFAGSRAGRTGRLAARQQRVGPDWRCGLGKRLVPPGSSPDPACDRAADRGKPAGRRGDGGGGAAVAGPAGKRRRTCLYRGAGQQYAVGRQHSPLCRNRARAFGDAASCRSRDRHCRYRLFAWRAQRLAVARRSRGQGVRDRRVRQSRPGRLCRNQALAERSRRAHRRVVSPRQRLRHHRRADRFPRSGPENLGPAAGRSW